MAERRKILRKKLNKNWYFYASAQAPAKAKAYPHMRPHRQMTHSLYASSSMELHGASPLPPLHILLPLSYTSPPPPAGGGPRRPGRGRRGRPEEALHTQVWSWFLSGSLSWFLSGFVSWFLPWFLPWTLPWFLSWFLPLF